MCQTLLGSKCHLHTFVTTREFVKCLSTQKGECKRVKEAFSNNKFVKDLKTAFQILIPLDRLIVKYQSDKVPVSETMPDILALPEEFQ